MEELWVYSGDRRACFKLRLEIVEYILPNIRTTLAAMSNNHAAEANFPGIMIRPMRGDVLSMIVEFVRSEAGNSLSPDRAEAWRTEYFVRLSTEFLRDSLQEVERFNMVTGDLTHDYMRLLESTLNFHIEQRSVPTFFN